MGKLESDQNRVVWFLKSRSADLIPHVNGTLLAHLKGTCDLLRDWNNPTEVSLAGLCHTIYGTQGFPLQLLNLSQRLEARKLIGPRAEELVYFFASCDRSYLYPQIGFVRPVQFRDRFSGATFTPDESLFKAFLELTFANELDGARTNPNFANDTHEAVTPLFTRCRGLVSDAAFAHFRKVYEI